MSIPFSRTIRSLNADNMRAIQVGLAILALLMVAWLFWFFLARVSFYEISKTAQLTQEGIIIADFSPQALVRIRQGQSATFRFVDALEQPQTMSLIVVDIDLTTGQIQLIPRVEDSKSKSGTPLKSLLHDGLRGVVEIVVEQISPASVVMRAAGLKSV